MSDSRLTDGTDAVTSLTPRSHPVGNDPGFFALDRRVWRTVKDQYGGTISRWYLDLAAECSRKTPNRYQHGRVSEIAQTLGESTDTTRRVLTQLEAAGMIRWTRATNQNNGEIVLLIDLERHKTPRPTRVPIPATPEAETVTPDAETVTFDAVDNRLGAGLGAAVGAALGAGLGAVDLHRPLQVKQQVPRTKNQEHVCPPDALRDPERAPVEMAREDEQHNIIEQAAQMVAIARENKHGKKAGTGAIRKIADDLTADQSDVIARWLVEGHQADRIAVAVADRYRAIHDGINEKRHAVPWSPGENKTPEPDTLDVVAEGEVPRWFAAKFGHHMETQSR
jgi:hypothetical protein